MRLPLTTLFIIIVLAGCNHSFQDYTEIKDLSGTWSFELDPDNKGLEEKWFTRQLSDNIQLPGTTDENPEARQLYYSMLKYVSSDKFSSEKAINKNILHNIIP